jgi:hypothetical protein
MLTGAIAGALCDEDDPIPPEWRRSLSRLRGIAVPELKGLDLERAVESFASMVGPGRIR